jgi:hypothetical protein
MQTGTVPCKRAICQTSSSATFIRDEACLMYPDYAGWRHMVFTSYYQRSPVVTWTRTTQDGRTLTMMKPLETTDGGAAAVRVLLLHSWGELLLSLSRQRDKTPRVI